ncbi:hypothetical protein NUW58_g3933 [Xylaria curta]|uniref:Uncharacterized protein n=1 Tax=Xylaria curta TaxID=42375 RepID=A0ACC1PAB3_9PEZI|nr:hypothetical protein NUW58_g3933 [Xylaria curta]
MKPEIAAVILAAGALAAPSDKAPRKAAAACSSAVKLDASTNVWKNYKLHANSFYRKEVQAALEQISDSSLKSKAAKVADVGSFLWLGKRAHDNNNNDGDDNDGDDNDDDDENDTAESCLHETPSGLKQAKALCTVARASYTPRRRR